MAHYLTQHRAEWAPRTTARKLAAFRRWGKFVGHPEFLADYKPPSAGDAKPHPLPGGMADVHKMLAVTKDTNERVLVALCGLAALRVGEALSITARSFNADRTLTVRGKGDKTRTIPLRDDIWQYLDPAIAANRGKLTPLVDLHERWARRLITRIGARAGIGRPVASHDLRATLATAMYLACKDIRAVQEYLGHASVLTTQVYVGVAQDAMRSAVNAA